MRLWGSGNRAYFLCRAIWLSDPLTSYLTQPTTSPRLSDVPRRQRQGEIGPTRRRIRCYGTLSRSYNVDPPSAPGDLGRSV
jgi:hypothetical protein